MSDKNSKNPGAQADSVLADSVLAEPSLKEEQVGVGEVFRERVEGLPEQPANAEAVEAMRTHAIRMADRAYGVIGASNSVSVEDGGRYLEYTLDKSSGVGSVAGLSSRSGEYIFETPVLIAMGNGLEDPRGPIPLAEFLHMLNERRMYTNDKQEFTEAEATLDTLMRNDHITSENANALLGKLRDLTEAIKALKALKSEGKMNPYFGLRPEYVDQMLAALKADLDSKEKLDFYSDFAGTGIETLLGEWDGYEGIEEALAPFVRQYVV